MLAATDEEIELQLRADCKQQVRVKRLATVKAIGGKNIVRSRTLTTTGSYFRSSDGMLVNESETCKNGVLNPGYGMRGGTIMRDGAAYFLEFKRTPKPANGRRVQDRGPRPNSPPVADIQSRH